MPYWLVGYRSTKKKGPAYAGPFLGCGMIAYSSVAFSRP